MYCWHFNEVRLAVLIALIEFLSLVLIVLTRHQGSLSGSAFYAVIIGIISWATLRALNPKKKEELKSGQAL